MAGKTVDDHPAIALRGHHFLCLLTYKGYGYTPGFVDNMTAIAGAINSGRPVRLVIGPDDICGALSADDRIACDHDCFRAETMMIDERALKAVEPFFPDGMAGEFFITPDIAARLRSAFAEGSIRAACSNCRWKVFCDDIAADGFTGTLLQPSP
ncbi:DUF1284 domain-containing protein [Rhizobium sp. NRK18]|uniref:DUF1284 domain-containing protein n=1 Tax=Rhizobium sp. NRK18 TaxID=2964667 RepID=UPI0021C4A35F|nr:DUF1284 domain-containing protein [Rhizobium sp. NRK18]MCQ2005095.1 DUF1284 domain-containing protein [Rhizobium sp. NRK18]